MSLTVRSALTVPIVVGLHWAIITEMTHSVPADAPVPEPPAMEASFFNETIDLPVNRRAPHLVILGKIRVPEPLAPKLDPLAPRANEELPVALPAAPKRLNTVHAATIDSDDGLTLDKEAIPFAAEAVQSSGDIAPTATNIRIRGWLQSTGRVIRVRIVRSSGAKWLDRAAIAYVTTWSLRMDTDKLKRAPMWVDFTLRISNDDCCRTLQLVQLTIPSPA